VLADCRSASSTVSRSALSAALSHVIAFSRDRLEVDRGLSIP
jgi:hypothetical protein